MRRLLTLLFLTLPIWAQFQPAPSQQPYPQDVAQSQYPSYPTQQQPQYSTPGGGEQQERDLAADQQHGVARLRIVQGDVNVKRGDNGMLTGAIMNAPLFSHDHLETGPGSRAEAQLDNASVIRLAPDTDLNFASLVFGRAQAQLGIGTVIVRVMRDAQTQIEIDTPSVAFHPVTAGEYRISVFDNGTSQVTVRSGRLEMSGPRGSQNVEQGQSLIVRGDANDPEFQQAYELPRDQFDEWSSGRDGEMMPTRSAQYVAADVYGTEDLDRYGNWVPSEYGQVWAPQGVPQDWSPYSNGQWSYADYYGWNWIGYEPWGWAPYHYGRWFYNGGVGWCWWPGVRVGFGFHWSPALVSFFGFGSGLGWVSLAPYEVYHPWWGRGGFGRYDSFRVGFGFRGYRNAGIRGGALTAGFNSFGGAGHRFAAANSGQLRSASFYRGSIPFSPNASSYRFSERSVNSNPRFSQSSSRTFFSRPSTSYNNSRYSTGGSFNGSRYSSPSTGGGSSSGWQHFGSPAPQRQQQPQNFSSRPNGNAESGWHNFGQPSSNSSYGYRAPSTSNYGGRGYRQPAAPSYRQPATPNYNYRTPAATPRYSAPSSPRYSAPSAPRSSGGGNRSSGGGGGHSSGGGGGRHR